MIINYLNLVGITFMPAKTNAPLFVDSDAVLPSPIPRQLFQTIAGNCSKIFKLFCSIELPQLSQGDALDIRWQLSCGLAIKKCRRLAIAKAPDHPIIIT